MSITDQGSFLYHGSAFGLAAHFDHPNKATIPTQAQVVLSPSGGEASSQVTGFRMYDVSFEEAAARAAGSQDPDGSRHTDVTARVRGLRFLHFIEADLVVARVNSVHRIRETRKGVIDEAEVTFTGSNISGLYVAGKRIDFEVDTEPFSSAATYEQLRKAPARGRVFAHGSADDSIRVDSIVKHIDCQPLSDAEKESVRDPNFILKGVRCHDNVIWVPHFGKIFLGEVVIQRGYRRITMLRVELGCGTGGGGSAGGGDGNGGDIPPGGP